MTEIECKPDRLCGIPTLKGTRISVGQILAELAEGLTASQIEKQFFLKEGKVVALLNDLAGNMERITRAVMVVDRLDRMDTWYADTIVSGQGIDLELKITSVKKTDSIENRYQPDSVSCPGETISEILHERGTCADDLALHLNLSKAIVCRIISGDIEIDRHIADGLARALGLPAHFWLRREKQYRDSIIDIGG